MHEGCCGQLTNETIGEKKGARECIYVRCNSGTINQLIWEVGVSVHTYLLLLASRQGPLQGIMGQRGYFRGLLQGSINPVYSIGSALSSRQDHCVKGIQITYKHLRCQHQDKP